MTDKRVPRDLPGALEAALHTRDQIWPHTMDAKVWADEWFKHNGPSQANDHSAMLGWFANAIMAGYDTAQMRAPAAPDEREEYARRNPLGGPARTFEAMAERLRAGDSLGLVLADFGYATAAERDALKAALRELVEAATPFAYPAFVGDRFPAAIERAHALLAAPEDAP